SISPTGSFTVDPSVASFTVSTDPSGIAGGSTCNGSVLIAAASGVRTIPVTFVVSAVTVTPSLTATPSNLLFTAPAAGVAPSEQALAVTATVNTTATIQTSELSCSSTTWLTVSPNGSFNAGPTSTAVTVSVNQSGLLAGSLCRGLVTLTGNSNK